MAKASVEAPRRFREKSEAPGDARLGALFRSVADPSPLSARDLARVRERLRPSRRTTSAERRRRELLLAAGMLLAGASFAFASIGVQDWWRHRSVASPSEKAATRTAPVRSVATGATSRPLPPAPSALPEREPASVESAASAPLPSSTASIQPSASPTAKSNERLAAEAHALTRVLVKLRRQRDARGALALLDESESLFAHGTLALEARVARIDALLLLERRAEARALLDDLPFGQVGRGGELRLLRAELWAASDCRRALSDFDALLRLPLAAPLAERALYGRAGCELRLGERAQAERDLNQYLAQFPTGRFRAQAHSQLSGLSDTFH